MLDRPTQTLFDRKRTVLGVHHLYTYTQIEYDQTQYDHFFAGEIGEITIV